MGLLGFGKKDPNKVTDVKFSDIYRQAGKKEAPVSAADKSKAKKALIASGYLESKAKSIVYGDKKLSPIEMKKVISHLKQNQFQRFKSKTPDRLVNNYLRQESIRKRNIERSIIEKARERRAEANLAEQKTLSPKSNRPQKPNLKF